MLAHIGFTTGTNRGQLDELHDRRRDESGIHGLGLQGLRDRPLDVGQGLGESGQAARLQRLAHLGPSRVIAILQPAGRVGADSLQVRGGIRGIAHVDIGGRHGQRLQARNLLRIAQQRAGLEAKAEARAAALPPHGQRLGADDRQAVLARQRFNKFSLGLAHADTQRCRRTTVATELWDRAFVVPSCAARPLPERRRGLDARGTAANETVMGAAEVPR